MYKGKNILAIVPARGGSKGIKLKNIYPFLGKPLIVHTADFIKNIDYIDVSIVSTDNEEIARIANESGLGSPFMRPPEISGDSISDFDVLHHALLESEKHYSMTFDVILMLQPTSPIRKESYISSALDKLIDDKYDSIWSVSVTDSKAHPLKQLKIDNDELDFYEQSGKEIIARQQLTTLYHRNGIVYAFTRDCLIDQKTIYGKKSGALLIEEHCISIDTIWDLELAEYICMKNNKNDG